MIDGLVVRSRTSSFALKGKPQNVQVIVGVVILIACSVVVMNIVVDLLYAVFDPRIRYG